MFTMEPFIEHVCWPQGGKCFGGKMPFESLTQSLRKDSLLPRGNKTLFNKIRLKNWHWLSSSAPHGPLSWQNAFQIWQWKETFALGTLTAGLPSIATISHSFVHQTWAKHLLSAWHPAGQWKPRDPWDAATFTMLTEERDGIQIAGLQHSGYSNRDLHKVYLLWTLP